LFVFRYLDLYVLVLDLYLVIWICNVLVLDLFVFGCLDLYVFFNRYFGFVFRFVNFVPKGPKIIIIIIIFEKIKTCPETSPKPKLKGGFQTAGYKRNNR
jgi:hypothetical protein